MHRKHETRKKNKQQQHDIQFAQHMKIRNRQSYTYSNIMHACMHTINIVRACGNVECGTKHPRVYYILLSTIRISLQSSSRLWLQPYSKRNSAHALITKHRIRMHSKFDTVVAYWKSILLFELILIVGPRVGFIISG